MSRKREGARSARTGAGLRARRVTAAGLCALLGLMGGFVWFSPELYAAFCRATGYGGTPSLASSFEDGVASPAASEHSSGRIVTIGFNADISRRLPWEFAPAQEKMEVRVGERVVANYRARNLSEEPRAGFAVFNVTPFKVGPYVQKMDCFCFSEQELAAGEEAAMPVTFYLDPAMEDDPHLDDVSEVTLSYTFYPSRTALPHGEEVQEVQEVPEGEAQPRPHDAATHAVHSQEP